jgi:hypothetical protein
LKPRLEVLRHHETALRRLGSIRGALLIWGGIAWRAA